MGDKLKELKWCTNCLTMSTRPRITFDHRGWCNACIWMETKKSVNWDERKLKLEKLLEANRSQSKGFDCLVPVSGGKDGSYVAFNLKHNFGMNPLCVTVTPALPLQLGEENLRAFVESGYNHISINPDYEAMRKLNKIGFAQMGFPYFGWLTAIQTAPIRLAVSLGINLIFYGEDGEVEYGGENQTEHEPIYDTLYQKRVYLEGGHERVMSSATLSAAERYFFEFPSDLELKQNNVQLTHWSYFENWDPYRNYLVAREKCGLKEAQNSNAGTFTNFAQNDQALYSLHTYLMYLKFGFGRANQDASIEIRRGAMDRTQARNLVKLYDGYYPEEFIVDYLDYYKMSMQEFNNILDSFANRNLFEKKEGRWKPTFEIL